MGKHILPNISTGKNFNEKRQKKNVDNQKLHTICD